MVNYSTVLGQWPGMREKHVAVLTSRDAVNRFALHEHRVLTGA